MKPKFILTVVFLFFIASFIRGQDEKRKFLFLEAGIDFISCNQPDKDYIRGDINPYLYGRVTDQIRSLMQLDYFGVKFEYRMVHNVLGLSGGFRYIRMRSSIGKPTYWSSTPDFFYIQFGTNGTTTEYAKVREINQKSGYLGIPLELRIYPYAEHPVNLFYKVGGSFNFRMSSKKDIIFFDSIMEQYQNDVTQVIENNSPYYTTINIGMGFKIGKLSRPGAVIEASLPVAVITPDKSNFVDPTAGVGFQLMVRVPF